MKIVLVIKDGKSYTVDENVSLHIEQGNDPIGIPGNVSMSQTKAGVTESITCPLDKVSKLLIEV